MERQNRIMSARLTFLAVSTAALLAATAGGALADGSASASASSGASAVSHSDPTSGQSTVGIGAGANENAAAQPGAGSNSTAGGGGSGIAGTFYFVIGSRPTTEITTESVTLGGGTIAVEGSFAGAGAGTHGSVWAQGAIAEAGSPESGPVGGGGGSATLYCKLTIKDWSKWWDYSRDARKAVQRCDCPTIPKIAKLSKACPAKPTEVFAATVD